MERFSNPTLIAAVSYGLLILGLVLDLMSTQRLVVAILFNIPIALSAIALSRRLTVSVVLFALIANIAAGYVNSLEANSHDLITLENRLLAAFSFLLVGSLTLFLRNSEVRIDELEAHEQHTRHLDEVFSLVNELGQELYPEPLLNKVVIRFREFLDADEVIISPVTDENKFGLPRYASPMNAGMAQEGHAANWALNTLPVSSKVVCLRQNDGLVAVGRWERKQKHDFLVIVRKPRIASPKELLERLIAGLEPALERAYELRRLKREKAET
ncbi:MAG: hypothetical protein KC422_05470 [Trueperaceae bacterium]|nr:hypothetical protein [Trueperaceae bacterium]